MDNNNIKLEDMFAVKSDGADVLGKLVYFSLPNVLIERDKLIEICESMNLPVSVGSRISEIDSFKSATGDIYDRVVDREYGEVRIRKVYARDNQSGGNVVSRELISETLGEHSNRYVKLANMLFDKDSKSFDYVVEDYGSDLDITGYCRKAQELFETYRLCIGRGQLENIVDSFLHSLESLKVISHGKVYFTPKKTMHQVSLFEDFLETVNMHNKRPGTLTINSLYVANDQRQRGKMSVEFNNAVRQEIALYIEKLENLVAMGSSNATVMERWVAKVSALEAKKADYEALLQCELSEVDEQYQTLRFLSSELSVRAAKLRLGKCA
jgi:hypothetical protein